MLRSILCCIPILLVLSSCRIHSWVPAQLCAACSHLSECQNVLTACACMQVETLSCDMIAEGRLRGYIDQVR